MRSSLALLLRLQSLAVLTPIALFNMTTLAATPFPEVSQLPAQTGLPDPLAMFNGERVTSSEQWSNQRRPELKALFEHYMYGEMPPSPARIESTVERVDKQFFG